VIGVVYFFGVKRRKRYNGKRDPQGNALRKGGQAQKFQVAVPKIVSRLLLRTFAKI